MSKKRRRGENRKKPIRKTPLLAPKPDHKKARRKIKREAKVIEQLSQEATPTEPTDHVQLRGRGDSGLILTDPHRLRSDIKLVEAAVRKGWNVRRKTMVRRRMEEIVAKTEAEVVTKEGLVKLESAADKLAIDAAKVLTAMDNQDINRITKLKESAGQPVSPINPVQVNVNVSSNGPGNVNTTATVFDSRTIELARLAASLGAREFHVDGKPVPIADIVGTVSGLPANVPAVESDP